MSENIQRLVNKFLAWPLPATVCSDPCVTIYGYEFPRLGTNLLTSDEARQMFEFVVNGLEEVGAKEEIREAVGGLHLDLSWLMNGAGTHVTIDTKKLIALLKATDRL